MTVLKLSKLSCRSGIAKSEPVFRECVRGSRRAGAAGNESAIKGESGKISMRLWVGTGDINL